MAQLDQYRIFESVARNKGFCRAAEELYITQPAVSRTIRLLEAELNTRLFIRNSRGVELTVSGKELYTYVEQALALIKSAENHIGEVGMLESGTLRIGAGDTICRHYLLTHLRRFHELYPNISLKVTNRTSKETAELVRQGRVDIGFVSMPTELDDSLAVTPVIELHDCFVYSKRHFPRLSDKKHSLTALADYPLLMLETESSTRRCLDAYCRRENVALHPTIELGSHDLLLSFAQIGLGVAAVVREYCGEAFDNGSLSEAELTSPLPPRFIGLIYRSRIPLALAAKEFLRLSGVTQPRDTEADE